MTNFKYSWNLMKLYRNQYFWMLQLTPPRLEIQGRGAGFQSKYDYF